MEKRRAEGVLSLAALGAVFLLPACAAEPLAESEVSTTSAAMLKNKMLYATDLAMIELLARAAHDLKSLRQEYESTLEQLPTPIQLNVIDAVLETYKAEEVLAHRQRVRELEKEYERQFRDVLQAYEDRLWTVAKRAGATQKASDFSYISGYRELDEMVEVSLAQLGRVADLEGLIQQSTIREYDRVELNRTFRTTIDGLGQFLFFVSAPESRFKLSRDPSLVALETRRNRDAESVAYAYVFRRIDLPDSVPIRFIHASRAWVERTGLVVLEGQWRKDPGIVAGDGVVPIVADFHPPTILATEVGFPTFDLENKDFRQFHSYTLVQEYRLGLQRTDTHEILLTFAWRTKWSVDSQGEVRVTEDPGERMLEVDTVLPALFPPEATPGAVPEKTGGDVSQAELRSERQ